MFHTETRNLHWIPYESYKNEGYRVRYTLKYFHWTTQFVFMKVK
jgi:hypothetical protein